jgi:hypothetical protein
MPDGKIITEKVCNHKVQLISGKGFRFAHYNPAPNPTGKGGAIRGKITGWSKASRRRMREAMLWSKAPDGWDTLGFTLTVPGSVLSLEDAKELWGNYSRVIQKQGFSMVWRLEIQARGQLHWHGIAFVPSNCAGLFEMFWKMAVDGLGPDVHVTDKGEIYQVMGRMELPGASKHAVDVQTGQGAQKAAWFRYLQDHASKSKQEQVAESCGRHWGIVGRKMLGREAPEDVALNDDDFYKVLRICSRWARRRTKADCVFGCKKFPRTKRGSRGASVWFEGQDLMPRVLAWLVREKQDDEHLVQIGGEPVDF